MKILGHTTNWSGYDKQCELFRWHSQGLWNKGFNLGDAFSKSLSIFKFELQQSPRIMPCSENVIFVLETILIIVHRIKPIFTNEQ